jgi:hypothetical protein
MVKTLKCNVLSAVISKTITKLLDNLLDCNLNNKKRKPSTNENLNNMERVKFWPGGLKNLIGPPSFDTKSQISPGLK